MIYLYKNYEKMYTIKLSTRYKKEFKKLSRNIKILKELYFVISKLQNWSPLDIKYKDHKLQWDWEWCRECHISPDLLLIYEIDNRELTLYLLRLNSHSEIF